jgi:hypothetical protein
MILVNVKITIFKLDLKTPVVCATTHVEIVFWISHVLAVLMDHIGIYIMRVPVLVRMVILILEK